MEISRRHLQELEAAELRSALVIDGKTITGFSDHPPTPEEVAAQERAAEMQAQVEGLTRNQRRVLNKRMAKAQKRK